MESANRKTSCCTMPIERRRLCCVTLRTSSPSMVMLPDETS